MSIPRWCWMLALLLVALPGLTAVAGPAEDAQAAADAGRWQDAADVWSAVLERKPKDRAAALGLAEAVIQGNLGEQFYLAEEALGRLLDAKENDKELRKTLGNVFIGKALSKRSDPQAMKFIFEDARTLFEDLLAADATDEDAAVGLTRVHYWTADFANALGTIDTFLESGKSEGPILYWKGQVLYLQALDAYRAAGAVDETAKGLFQRAKGSYEAATALDGSNFDAWLQLGYCAQYTGEVEAAQAAYERAMDLDGQSWAPLKGIEALYAYRADAYPRVLAGLVSQHPDNVAVHFFLGYQRFARKQYDDAAESFRTYAEEATDPSRVWSYLGQALEGAGEGDEAEAVYLKALRANPADESAAAALDRRIRDGTAAEAASSPKAARAMVAAYADLFALAPENPWVRNNVAFVLREALARGGGSGAWKPVLEDCVRIYEEAADLVERQVAGREATLPHTRLHQYAGILNDTGLMFQYYPSIRDYDEAERYYGRALDLTIDGYFDAFTNLVKIYREQSRWQDLYDLAEGCAEGMKNADGSAHTTGRGMARGEMARLLQEGKAEAR